MKAFRAILAAVFLYSTGIVTGVLAMRAITVHRLEKDVLPSGFGPVQQLTLVHRALHDIQLPNDKLARLDTMVRESQRHLRKLLEPMVPLARAEVRFVVTRSMEELSPEERVRLQKWLKDAGSRRPGLSNLWWFSVTNRVDDNKTLR